MEYPGPFLRSPPVFSGVCVTRSLVLCVCFVDRCLSFCPFFFWPLCCLFFLDLLILITPSYDIYQYVFSEIKSNSVRMGFTYPIPDRWRMCTISYSVPRWRTAISCACGQCRSSNMIYYAEMHRQSSKN